MTRVVLITGGAGFIGSAVVRLLFQETDWRLVNIDKLTYAGNLVSLSQIKSGPRYAFEQLDICDAASMQHVFKKYNPNAVMHLAAESHVDRSIDGPREFIDTNIKGTYTLLEAAREHWERLHPGRKAQFKFHHISTDEVFGSLGETGLFDETTPYRPSSPYSASKASADHLVRAWWHTFGLPTVVSNCSNNYGPYQYPEKLIPVAIGKAVAGVPIPVYGTGANVRDWLYVDDHARALRLVLEHGEVGETYNVGGKCEVTNLQLVKKICHILDDLNPRSSNRHEELIEFVADRPGHDLRYAIDATKIDRELGWRPKESLDSGLDKTVKWYLNSQEWVSAAMRGKYSGERLGLRRQR